MAEAVPSPRRATGDDDLSISTGAMVVWSGTCPFPCKLSREVNLEAETTVGRCKLVIDCWQVAESDEIDSNAIQAKLMSMY